MKAFKTVTITSLAASLALCSSASAVVLASTSFDGKTLSPSNTANNLGWTVNGLADPGSMAAFNATGGAQAIFNGGDTPNIFTPGINTGIDNLSINGTIGAVPEPSAILLSSLSLLVLAGRRRR